MADKMRMEISERTCHEVVNYYNELFCNFEVQTISEIAEFLNIGKSTLRIALSKIYHGPKSDGTFSKIDIQILVCTKFGPTSPYLEDQQREDIQRIIKRREIYLLYTKSQEQKPQDEISHKRR